MRSGRRSRAIATGTPTTGSTDGWVTAPVGNDGSCRIPHHTSRTTPRKRSARWGRRSSTSSAPAATSIRSTNSSDAAICCSGKQWTNYERLDTGSLPTSCPPSWWVATCSRGAGHSRSSRNSTTPTGARCASTSTGFEPT